VLSRVQESQVTGLGGGSSGLKGGCGSKRKIGDGRVTAAQIWGKKTHPTCADEAQGSGGAKNSRHMTSEKITKEGLIIITAGKRERGSRKRLFTMGKKRK